MAIVKVADNKVNLPPVMRVKIGTSSTNYKVNSLSQTFTSQSKTMQSNCK